METEKDSYNIGYVQRSADTIKDLNSVKTHSHNRQRRIWNYLWLKISVKSANWLKEELPIYEIFRKLTMWGLMSTIYEIWGYLTEINAPFVQKVCGGKNSIRMAQTLGLQRVYCGYSSAPAFTQKLREINAPFGQKICSVKLQVRMDSKFNNHLQFREINRLLKQSYLFSFELVSRKNFLWFHVLPNPIAQCGNLRISLLVRFYVKLIFALSESQKCLIWQF